ncbi:hypothetical protein P3W85_44960 [Cupriavidus basilensis]|uniref:DUF3325 domain-containing protein n=1 Tax=Cupriavidus basilensis TaxID=68895 RepID=A0ABT6B616_9BURK|nr:hypothetical protein [Cupriavidus basilensis]MDF3840027.1 hypothetical protein [Cupriavidus basilensis]
MQVFALLLGLGGACCLYLASPNQRLLPLPPGQSVAQNRGTRLCWLGVAAIAVSAWAWSTTQGWPAATVATLATVGTGLSLWPFAGAYRDARRQHPVQARR